MENHDVFRISMPKSDDITVMTNLDKLTGDLPPRYKRFGDSYEEMGRVCFNYFFEKPLTKFEKCDLRFASKELGFDHVFLDSGLAESRRIWASEKYPEYVESLDILDNSEPVPAGTYGTFASPTLFRKQN